MLYTIFVTGTILAMDATQPINSVHQFQIGWNKNLASNCIKCDSYRCLAFCLCLSSSFVWNNWNRFVYVINQKQLQSKLSFPMREDNEHKKKYHTNIPLENKLTLNIVRTWVCVYVKPHSSNIACARQKIIKTRFNCTKSSKYRGDPSIYLPFVGWFLFNP